MGDPDTEHGDDDLPSVSVVIPTRGRREILPRTVSAVLADPAATEVIVVIDGDALESESGLLPLAGADARLRIARLPASLAESHGEQRVRSYGAALARSPVILALDDDIVASPGLAAGHARWHAREDGVVVLGYMPLAPPAAGFRWTSATRLYAEGYERACERFERDPDAILLGLWGGNFSVRREHWKEAEAIEGIAPGFMHTDREFGLRLHRLGLHGRFDRSLRSVHHDVRDTRRLADAARGSAIAHVRLLRVYGDLIDPERDGDGRRSRRILSALLPVVRRPRAFDLALGLLGWLTRAAYVWHLEACEYALTRLAWRLAYERELARAARAHVRARLSRPGASA